MPRTDQISINAEFTDGDILTGYGTEYAEGFDGCDIERYLRDTVQVTAMDLNVNTNMVTITLADGTQITGPITE